MHQEHCEETGEEDGGEWKGELDTVGDIVDLLGEVFAGPKREETESGRPAEISCKHRTTLVTRDNNFAENEEECTCCTSRLHCGPEGT